MEDHESTCLLGRGASIGGIGQVDIVQHDPVGQGCFLGHDQSEVATSETLESDWTKADQNIRTQSLSAETGDGLLGDNRYFITSEGSRDPNTLLPSAGLSKCPNELLKQRADECPVL